jgi:hypothetical protein
MACQSDASPTENPQRIAFVLIDGLGDVSIPFLDGKTPLQFASTKFLNSVAGRITCIIVARMLAHHNSHLLDFPPDGPKDSSLLTEMYVENGQLHQ